jgi:hypothetical protein
MQMCGGVEVYLHYSWGQHYVEPSGQLHDPVALATGEIVPDTPWIGRRVGRRASLDAVEKILTLQSVRSPSLYRLSYLDS